MIDKIAILDHGYERFYPLTKTRPVAALLAGAFTFEERVRRVFPTAEVVVLAHAEVAKAFSARSGLRSAPFPKGASVLFLLPNAVFDLAFARAAEAAEPNTVFRSGDTAVGALLEGGSVPSNLDALGLPEIEVDVLTVPTIWGLVRLNGEIVLSDFKSHFPRAVDGEVSAQATIYGENAVAIDRSAEIFAGAVLDAREGPIIVSRGAVVRPGAVVQGPCYIGPGTEILSGWIRGACSFGPTCKLGGEVESSIFIGWSNKAHEGFVGHSYVGQWVNLGALTTTSDLKNNYGEVRVDLGGGQIGTGQIKVGSFIGDHSKTGIGALLNSGTCIGVSVNHYGTGLPPKSIADFSWGTSDGYVEYDVEKAVRTARTVMSRRGMEMLPEEENLLRAIHADAWPKL
ncbi:hypothetical protein J7L01_02350 [bacterium]|nr:hypothetical protein [bacterium]